MAWSGLVWSSGVRLDCDEMSTILTCSVLPISLKFKIKFAPGGGSSVVLSCPAQSRTIEVTEFVTHTGNAQDVRVCTTMRPRWVGG